MSIEGSVCEVRKSGGCGSSDVAHGNFVDGRRYHVNAYERLLLCDSLLEPAVSRLLISSLLAPRTVR